jgi:Icc-related predicted phosphoesterase
MITERRGFQSVDSDEIVLHGVKDIILMGDVGCTGLSSESLNTVNKILAKKADVFFLLGDLACSGSGSELKELAGFCEKNTGAPLFALKGNHDIPDYCKVFGSSDYAVVLDHAVLVCLDNSTKVFSDRSRDLLSKTLKKYNNKKFVILFHIPPPNDMQARCVSPEEWSELKKILDPYKENIKCILCGHVHGFMDYNIDGYRVLITGGGGAILAGFKLDQLKCHRAIKLSFDHTGDPSIETIVI